MKIKKVIKKKKDNSEVLEALALQIKEKEAEANNLDRELDGLYLAYATEKTKNFKIGKLYEYTEQGKTVQGVLTLKADRKEHTYPLRLQLIKKDGSLGTQIRIVYREENLTYVGERDVKK